MSSAGQAMSSSCSLESSFSDSDVFTKPTISKYLIKQGLLLHWKRICWISFILNTLFSAGWLVVDLLVLRR